MKKILIALVMFSTLNAATAFADNDSDYTEELEQKKAEDCSVDQSSNDTFIKCVIDTMKISNEDARRANDISS